MDLNWDPTQLSYFMVRVEIPTFLLMIFSKNRFSARYTAVVWRDFSESWILLVFPSNCTEMSISMSFGSNISFLCAKKLLLALNCSWHYLAALGSSWQLLADLGSSWQLLAALGSSWQLLTALGLSWLRFFPKLCDSSKNTALQTLLWKLNQDK